MSSIFAQSKSLSPEVLLSKSIVSTAQSQSEPAKAPPQTEKTTLKSVASQPVAEKPVETVSNTATSAPTGGLFNKKADPLNNSDRKSTFRLTQEMKDAQGDAPKTNVTATEEVKTEAKQESKPAGESRSLKSVIAETAKSQSNRAADGYNFKIQLNTLKVLKPLISAAVYAHGDIDSVDAGKALEAMGKETENLTKELCRLMEVDFLDQDKQWMVANLRATASEHVAVSYKRNPVADGFSCDHYIEAFEKAMTLYAVEPEKPDFPNMSESVRVKLSLAKSMTEPIREFALFENVVAGMVPSFTIDRAEVFEYTSKLIQEKAMQATEDIGVDRADEAFLITYQSMLNTAGSVIAHSVAFSCDRMLDKLDALPPAERTNYVNSVVKAGRKALIDLDLLERQFEKSMAPFNSSVKQSPLMYATISKSTPKP